MGKKKEAQVMKEQESGSFLGQKAPIASPAPEVGIQQQKQEVPPVVVPVIDPKMVVNYLKDLFLSRLYNKLEYFVDNLMKEPMDHDDRILVLYKLNKLIDSYNPDNLIKAINILTMRQKENLTVSEYLKRVLEVK
jgi:hypothetical protein